MGQVRVMRRSETGEMVAASVAPQLMTPELAEFIGANVEPVTYEVERADIRRYANAIGDKNPLYHDREYARKSKYGTTPSPPGFFGIPVDDKSAWQSPVFHKLLAKVGRRVGLDNGGEIEFYHPVRAGDVLTAVTQIVDFYEEVGRSGNRLLLLIFDTTYTNQDGEVVAVSRSRELFV